MKLPAKLFLPRQAFCLQDKGIKGNDVSDNEAQVTIYLNAPYIQVPLAESD